MRITGIKYLLLCCFTFSAVLYNNIKFPTVKFDLKENQLSYLKWAGETMLELLPSQLSSDVNGPH